MIIRGSRSVSGNNQPLYVMDGVPILCVSSEQTSTAIGGAADAGNRDAGDNISNLNPDDIESLSVLKGASASPSFRMSSDGWKGRKLVGETGLLFRSMTLSAIFSGRVLPLLTH